MAQLRMERGGSAFLSDCTESLFGLGTEKVLSPPLPRSAQRPWSEARFTCHSRLELLRRNLDELPAPDHLVALGSAADLPEVLRIDRAAFDEFWSFDEAAMIEATQATARAAIHVVRRVGEGLAGFAITGVGTAIAYLQRVAVDPSHQGRGIGTSLVRTAALWARRHGAGAIVLNTQADNDRAVGMYLAEGYRILPEELAVLGRHD